MNAELRIAREKTAIDWQKFASAFEDEMLYRHWSVRMAADCLKITPSTIQRAVSGYGISLVPFLKICLASGWEPEDFLK